MSINEVVTIKKLDSLKKLILCGATILSTGFKRSEGGDVYKFEIEIHTTRDIREMSKKIKPETEPED